MQFKVWDNLNKNNNKGIIRLYIFIFICTVYSVYIVLLSAAVPPDKATVDPL